MEFRGLTGVLYRGCEWVMRLAYLHLLWMLFSLMGVVVLGAAPATAAMFAVMRQWFLGREGVPVFRTYWQAYREGFWGANRLGGLFLVIAVILSVDLWVASMIDTMAGQVMNLFFLSLTFLFVITAVYAFPVFVHYRLSTIQYVKHALILGLSYLPYSIGMVGGGFSLAYCMRFCRGWPRCLASVWLLSS